jgi:hypothetical protein
MCGKGSAQSSQASQSSVSIPPEVLARYNAVNARAEDAANRPFVPYSGQFVAPLTSTQTGAISNITGAAGAAQPYFDQANDWYGQAGTSVGAGLAGASPYNEQAGGLLGQAVDASGTLTADQIHAFESPYTESVVKSTLGLLDQQQAQQQMQQRADAIMSGAFGGDRSGIASDVLAGQQNLARSSVTSNLYNQNYAQALAAAQQQQAQRVGALQQGAAGYAGLGQQIFGQGLGAAQSYQNLGTGLAGVGMQDLQSRLAQGQAQLGAGTLEQQTQQANLSALYNQFLQQQAYPFQTTQFLANIAEGTGALSGSSTQGSVNQWQPQPFFSDERLKDDIRTIGHTKDGLRIVRFRYKSDPSNTTHIGFLAQDVEKKKPDAVGEHAGFKTVDYDRATRARGGLVANDNAYEGYDDGGFVSGYDPAALAQMIAAHQAMYPGAAGRTGLEGSGPRGMQLRNASGRSLMRADLPKMEQRHEDPALRQAARGVSDISSAGKGVSDLYRAGKEAAVGSAARGAPGAADYTPASGGLFGTGGEWDSSRGWFGQVAGGLGLGAANVNMPAAGVVTQTLPVLPAMTQPAATTLSALDDPLRTVGMFANRGGRAKRYAVGGRPYESDVSYIPEPTEDDNEKRKLAVAPLPQMGGSGGGGGGGGGGSGLGDLASGISSAVSIGKGIGELATFLPTVLPFLSDRRAKEDIRTIGHTKDDIPIVRYRYKGQPETRLGLVAQDVEKKRPEAVGEYAGLKTVDYDRATRAGGGRTGYDEGGLVPPEVAQINRVVGEPWTVPGAQAEWFDQGLQENARPRLERAVPPPVLDAAPVGLDSWTVPRETPPPAGLALPPRLPPAGLAPRPAPSRQGSYDAPAPVPIAYAPEDIDTNGTGRYVDPRPGVSRQGGYEPPPAAPVAPPAAGLAPALPPPRTVGPSDQFNTYENVAQRHWVQESGDRQVWPQGHPKAGQVITSSAGAIGRSQLAGAGPEAAKLAGVEWDPQRAASDEGYNRLLGDTWLKHLNDRYGDPYKATAAYNAGSGAVDNAVQKASLHGGNYWDYLPDETKNHLYTVSGGQIGQPSGRGGGPAMAPAPASGGLAGAPATSAMPAPPQQQAAPRDFLDRAGDWFDRNERYIVPALSFLGNMLSSPSRTLAGSIGSGLAGVAEALPVQQRLGQGQQQIDIARNSQLIGLYNQLKAMVASQIRSSPTKQADPDTLAQMNRLAGMINWGAGTPGGGSAPGGQNPATGGGLVPGPLQGTQPTGGLVPPAAAPAQALPAPSGPGPTPTAAPDQSSLPPSMRKPLPNPKDPAFLQNLAPDWNPDELMRGAAVMQGIDPAQAAAMRAEAYAVQNRIMSTGMAVDRNGQPLPVPNWADFQAYQQRIPDNQAWVAKEAPIYQRRQVMRENVQKIADLLQQYETGGLNDIKADVQRYASALGVGLNDTATMNAAAFQKFLKEAAGVVMGDVTNDARTDEARRLLGTAFATPGIEPGAARAVLAQTMANLDWADKHYQATTQAIQKEPGTNRSLFNEEFTRATPLRPMIKEHEDKMAVRGDLPSTREDLQDGRNYMMTPSDAVRLFGGDLDDITRKWGGTQPQRVKVVRENGQIKLKKAD